jgi:uncharacterized protein YfaT (DUF1175 family)
VPPATSVIAHPRAAASLVLLLLAASWPVATRAQVRLADDTDRAAFRAWFVLLADAQFERPAPEITDCAALVRFAVREALRPHTPEWVRAVALPFSPQFPEVRSAPRGTARGLPIFRVADAPQPRYAEFADAKTIVALNTTAIGRDVTLARPGDLLYFRQRTQTQPDHLMIVVGRSSFDAEGDDWLVYHTGPSEEGPGEVRKVRLATLRQHPAPRWRPVSDNPNFVGVFRLTAMGAR